jgi:hypothetical protein
MSRKFEVCEQLCFVNGENCLNRLVLDDDALDHQRVDAITHFDLDPFVPDGQGNFAADLDAPATKFMGEACLIRRLQQTGPQCSVHLEHGVHYLLGNLLDLFFRRIHRPFPSRSLRLRGDLPFHREGAKNAKKVNELVHNLGKEVHGRGMSDTSIPADRAPTLGAP